MASTNQQQCSSKTESSSPPWSMSSRDSSQSSNDRSDSFRNGDPHNSYGSLHSERHRPTEDMHQIHDRILFLIAKLTGSRVQVSVKDGSKYEGILYSGSSQGELGIVLNDPITVTPSRVQTPTASPSILIMNKDLVSIMSSIMDDDLIVDNESCCGDQVEFGEQRELHESDDKVAGDLIFLDDDEDEDPSVSNKPFEIKTAFDDDDEPLTEIEQEKASTTSIHGLDEYGQLVDEDRMDEEYRYSSVAPTRPARAPSDYFINHKVEVFPAMDQEFICHSTHLDESTIPHFVAPSPMTNHICACEKRKEKVEQPMSRPLRHYSRVVRGKLYMEKYAHKMEDKDKHFAELVRFHQTFKLNFPIPADIEPLLSKQKQSTGKLDNEVFEQLYESQQNTTTTSTAKRITTKRKRPFEFNVHAKEFIPDPEIQEFLAAKNRGRTTASLSSLFPRSHRSALKNADTKHLTLDDIFKHPFSKNDVETPSHAIGPTWPFGTTQYITQFVDDAFEKGYTHEQLFTPSYNYIQYQYPHRYTPSMNPTIPTHEPSSTYATTDPQLARNNLTSPAFAAIPSFTGTETPQNSQYSPEAFLYTPLLPENDVPSSPSHNEGLQQQQEPHEYQGYYVANAGSTLASPHFVPETISPNHQTSPPPTDTMIQLMSPQPHYTGSEHSYWRI